ncbi:MAG: N-acetylneuraminate synthase family protein, partial [Anaerolineales bacterium]|nr:N-acetylneuraminate synthase family protein [Anaerolineales bacterium]
TAGYQYTNTGVETALEMAKLYLLPWDSHHAIASRCRELGIMYMASCFDVQAVDFLLSVGGDIIKIGSGEITNYPLLSYIASTGKVILLSTGMSTFEDVKGAVEHIRLNGDSELVLLQCVSSYPADKASANLLVMDTYAEKFGVNVGFSDHTVGKSISIAAVTLGACVIEKHFTADKSLAGPDHAMSLNPSELREFVASIRSVESALGDGNKIVHSTELETQKAARRSLFAKKSISVGEKLDDHNVTLKRPNIGIDPRMWETIQGRAVNRNIDADMPITWDV